jgi:hypothetical protein
VNLDRRTGFVKVRNFKPHAAESFAARCRIFSSHSCCLLSLLPGLCAH